MKSALRLRRAADFARTKRFGAVYRHPVVSLSVCRNTMPHNRYGIVTSRRLGKATVRNKARRRLRSILACWHGELSQGFDVVVVARPVMPGQLFADLQRIMEKLLLRAGLVGNC
jgi:ribonuclease P protein component